MTTEYGPGEILERILKSPNIGDPIDAYDILLYIDRISSLTIKGSFSEVRFQVGSGAITFQKVNFEDGNTMYLVEALGGETLFLAEAGPDKELSLQVEKTGPWMKLLEQAYDKVRSCIDSADKWKETFPPIGIVYLNKDGMAINTPTLETAKPPETEQIYG